MVVWVWLPRFALRAVARAQGVALDSEVRVALIEAEAVHPHVIGCTQAAGAQGVVAGMLTSRALGTCTDLVVLEHDPEAVARAGERLLRLLESTGAAVEPRADGVAVLESAGLEPMYGGQAALVRRLLDVLGVRAPGSNPERPSPDVRIGLGPNPFVASVAARFAQPGTACRIDPDEVRTVLDPLSIGILHGMDARTRELLEALGVTTLASLRAIGPQPITDRFGEPGLALWRLAGGQDDTPLQPRTPTEPVVETLRFPEPIANLQTLGRAVEILVGRAVARPDCITRAPRSVVVVAGLTTGSSWRIRRVLRTPTVDAQRITLTALAHLAAIPAPIEQVQVVFEEWALRETVQPQLDASSQPDRGAAGMRRAIGHVQAALGDESLLQVLEIEPWSRVPERHAVLVPRGLERRRTGDEASRAAGGGRS